jgi:hypothetical protein
VRNIWRGGKIRNKRWLWQWWMNLRFYVSNFSAKFSSAITWVNQERWDSIPGSNRDFSRRHRVHIDSGAHPAFYPMGTGGFPHGNESLATRLHLASKLRLSTILFSLSHTSSWIMLGHRGNFTLTLQYIQHALTVSQITYFKDFLFCPDILLLSPTPFDSLTLRINDDH